MGSKNANSIVIDKPSMAFAVASLQLSSRQIDAERAQLAELKKQLITDPECLSGDRAENYKEFLEEIDAFCAKITDAAILLRDEASKRNEKFNLEVDFKRIDAKAQDSLNKTKAARAKKLKGQIGRAHV